MKAGKVGNKVRTERKKILMPGQQRKKWLGLELSHKKVSLSEQRASPARGGVRCARLLLFFRGTCNHTLGEGGRRSARSERAQVTSRPL